VQGKAGLLFGFEGGWHDQEASVLLHVEVERRVNFVAVLPPNVYTHIA